LFARGGGAFFAVAGLCVSGWFKTPLSMQTSVPRLSRGS
jgi:hypothetical protein